jgi:hypothetical protein
MSKMREWVQTWLRISVGITAGLLLLAAVAVGQAATEMPKSQAAQTAPPAVQGQQLCSPGAGICKVVQDSPGLTAPAKTNGQSTIDFPGTKQPAKARKQSNPKSE